MAEYLRTVGSTIRASVGSLGASMSRRMTGTQAASRSIGALLCYFADVASRLGIFRGKSNVPPPGAPPPKPYRSVITTVKRFMKGIAGSDSDHVTLHKLIMTAATTLLLAAAVKMGGDVEVSEHDVLVYCAIYCFWVIFCLPDVLLSLNYTLLRKATATLFWLFAAEIAVAVYALLRGEDDILRRSVNMKPILISEVQWMADAIRYFRYAVVIGTMSESLVAHLFDRPQLLEDQHMMEEENREMSALLLSAP